MQCHNYSREYNTLLHWNVCIWLTALIRFDKWLSNVPVTCKELVILYRTECSNSKELIQSSRDVTVKQFAMNERRGTLYPQKLAITSPTSGGRSIGIVRSRTQTMEFRFFNERTKFYVSLDIMACSKFNVNWRFGRTHYHHPHGWRINQVSDHNEADRKKIQSSVLKTETKFFTETFSYFQYFTWHITEYRQLHNYRCENPIFPQ
jgi:hypothetical protein